MDEVFDVAVGACDRRLDEIVYAEAGAIEAGDDFVDDIDAHVDVTHDATLAEARPPGFVLRLDEQHERRIRGGEVEKMRRDLRQRDERDVGDTHVREWFERTGRQVAHVGSLPHRHSIVGTQSPVELAPADVDRGDVRRALVATGSR